MSGIALIVLAAAFVMGLIRAALGPTIADRAAAADLCLFTMVGVLALLAVRFDTTVFIDTALVATLLGFVATISLARLLRRKDDEP